MTTRTMGPASGWRWISNAVNLGGGNPRAVLGGAALLMAVALVPTVRPPSEARVLSTPLSAAEPSSVLTRSTPPQT